MGPPRRFGDDCEGPSAARDDCSFWRCPPTSASNTPADVAGRAAVLSSRHNR